MRRPGVFGEEEEEKEEEEEVVEFVVPGEGDVELWDED